MALPAFTVHSSGHRLEIKDNPALYWEFYGSFIIGGVVAIYVTCTSTLVGASLWAAVVISVGGVLAGMLLLALEPASVIVLDQAAATLTVTRWTLFTRSQKIFSLTDVTAAKIERKDEFDAAALVRPALMLTDGATLPISKFWYKKPEASYAVVERVNVCVAARSGTGGL